MLLVTFWWKRNQWRKSARKVDFLLNKFYFVSFWFLVKTIHYICKKKPMWSIFILKYLSYITTISNCNYYCNCISNLRVSQFDLEWQNKAMYNYSHKYHFDFDANYRYIIQQFYPCTWQSSCYVSPLKVKERFLWIQMWLHWTILKVILACIEQTSGRIIKCSLSPITK